MNCEAPEFPPLMCGERSAQDAFLQACKEAEAGCDAGLITYRIADDQLQAALVLAPETPIEQAMVMHPLCGVGLQNALGALSPPEVAVQLEWDGTIRINGAICGKLRVAAAPSRPHAEWLVVGIELVRLLSTDRPGDMPDHTSLFAEGCGGIASQDLIGAWARHCLHWINRWEADGPRALHAEWRGLLFDAAHSRNVAVDENFGLLRQSATGTQIISLMTLLETP